MFLEFGLFQMSFSVSNGTIECGLSLIRSKQHLKQVVRKSNFSSSVGIASVAISSLLGLKVVDWSCMPDNDFENYITGNFEKSTVQYRIIV